MPDLSIDSPEFRLLLDCLGFPTDGMQARYRRLGMSLDRGNRLKKELIDAGAAEGALIQVGRKRRYILRPTRSAGALASLNPAPYRGSVIHEFWKQYYTERFRGAGWKVGLEAARVGGRVDVLATRGKERVGIEIETGKSWAEKSQRNCLYSGFTGVIGAHLPQEENEARRKGSDRGVEPIA